MKVAHSHKRGVPVDSSLDNALGIAAQEAAAATSAYAHTPGHYTTTVMPGLMVSPRMLASNP